MFKVLLMFCAVLALSSATVFAADGNKESIQHHRPAVAQVMEEFVEDGTISGAVTLVGDKDGNFDIQSFGYSDIQAKRKMKKDDLFWVASMTKPIAAATLLILQDEGKLSVEDPVEKYLPEFKGMWMIQEKTTNQMTLVPAPRPITIQDLMTHTSGMGDFSSPRTDATLAELVMVYSQQPLRFPPGSKWEYCNSGINTLGRIAEVVSGEPFEEFLQKRILDPLGMKNTTFWPNASQAKRVAKSYKPGKGKGELEETSNFFLTGELTDRKRTPYPAGGLYSTAEDMGRFYQLMLNDGTWKGRRIISKKGVAQMTGNRTGDTKTGFVDGMRWGLGFQYVLEPSGVTSMLSPGTYGHGGAYATQSWADPIAGKILILMIQRAGFPNGDNSPVRKAFQEAAMSR